MAKNKKGLNTILIVDDEEGIRMSLKDFLEDNQFEVFTADNGQQALEIVEKEKIDVVMTDLLMPRMDGIEFYRRCIAYDSRLKEHFLFYSADVSSEREAFLKRNKLRFLRKPFGLSKFMDTMDQILRR